MATIKRDYRANPPGMLRHLGKVDVFKTLTNKFGRRTRALFRRFRTNLPIGSAAADFHLETVDGRTASLGEYRGKKHLVLEFGSIT